MAKEKVKKEKIEGFYKGYELKWLKDNPDHPDFHLVAEYENKKDKKKK